jgi:hypothetical protein
VLLIGVQQIKNIVVDAKVVSILNWRAIMEHLNVFIYAKMKNTVKYAVKFMKLIKFIVHHVVSQ